MSIRSSQAGSKRQGGIQADPSSDFQRPAGRPVQKAGPGEFHRCTGASTASFS